MKRQHQHPELKKKIEELSVHHKMGIEWWWEFNNVLDKALTGYKRVIETMKIPNE